MTQPLKTSAERMVWKFNRGVIQIVLSIITVPLPATSQEITLRVEAKEVVVPFVVTDQYGAVQACPAKESLSVRERGRVMPLRGVQTTSAGAVALGLVLTLDSVHSFTEQEDTRTAFALARDVLNSEDGCVAVNATGFERSIDPATGLPDRFDDTPKYPAKRRSMITEGRAGCLPFLEDLFQRMAFWYEQGEIVGLNGYTWAGVRLALQDLRRDPRLCRAILLLGRGIDRDHDGLPSDIPRQALAQQVPIYSLYFPPENRADPQFVAKWAKLARTPVPFSLEPIHLQRLARGLKNLKQVTQATGGKFYEVTEDNIFPIAKEIIASLRQQCQLTYEPPADGALGFRKIEVTISTPGWKVRHRPGYYPDQVTAPAKP